ncbi:class I SAM-dependent methyltransferase [Fulvimonas yonginensis]|uniref:Class I SAM-dependent methyltransferase n=1 Tax=Fulvimonas yonginensis TaxID=1495200 RepID=A0ABU8JCE0_9GAMM
MHPSIDHPVPAAKGIRWPRLYDLLVFGMTGGRERRFRRDVLRLSGIASAQRVLDVGCGTGTQAVAIARQVGPDGSVTAVDVAPEMLAVARRKAARARVPIEFRLAEATALPFPDRSFDRVLMCMAMHMLPEAEWFPCVRELARVLAPAGRRVLIDYAGPLAERASLMARHGPHGRFDLRRLREPVEAAGLRAVSIRPMERLDMHVLQGTRPAR